MRSDTRRRLARGFWLLGLATLAGCSTRHHSNPFDPENPDTHGRPRLLSAVAGDAVVHLAWRQERIDDLAGYRLERRGADGGVVILADSLGLDVSAWDDVTARNDSTYDYVLRVRFAGRTDLVETPAETATPGRRVLWILEGRAGNPLQVSPDGRDVLGRWGHGAPGRFDVDPATGDVLTGEAGAEGRLRRYAPGGEPLASAAFPGFLALSVMSTEAGAWVTGLDPGRLVRLGPDLRSVLSSDTLDANLQEVVFDRRTGDVWASDVDNARVFHRRKDGGMTAVLGFELPVSLAVDPISGDCWVADRRAGAVFRIDARTDTIEARAGGFEAPLDLAADRSGGGVWVTDGVRGIVVHLGPDGAEVARLEGFNRPYALALDPNGADLWITDAQTGELLRSDLAGTRRQRLGGLFSPFAIAVALPDTL